MTIEAERLYTPEEAGALWSRGKDYAYWLIHTGQVDVVLLPSQGGKRQAQRIPASSITRLQEANTIKGIGS